MAVLFLHHVNHGAGEAGIDDVSMTAAKEVAKAKAERDALKLLEVRECVQYCLYIVTFPNEFTPRVHCWPCLCCWRSTVACPVLPCCVLF